jgi:hypothetical protein
MALSGRWSLVKIAPFDAELNFAPNPGGFRNNPSSIANSDSEYLENLREKPVFWAQVTLFAQ